MDTPLSIQSYPFNLNACGAAMNSVNSDNILADACGRAAVRPHAAVRRVKNGPQTQSVWPSAPRTVFRNRGGVKEGFIVYFSRES